MIPSPEEKQRLYDLSLRQILAATERETDAVAVLASVVCILKTNLPHAFWVGFYRLDRARGDELVVGPYQGTFGCLRIPVGRGVCGLCAQRELPILVPNVNDFEDHIACDSRSASEIVVPVYDREGKFYGVLDLDSTDFDAFQDEDCAGLENILEAVRSKL